MTKRFFLLAVGILFIQSLFAQIPVGYYDGATGTGYTLKTQLYNIIKTGHIAQGYGDLYDAYVDGDTDPDDGYVWDMYSENPGGTDPYNYTHYINNCGTYSNEGDCLNREHLFPQGIFNEASPMKTDYHHVVPSDGKVNGMRSSYPFGEVETASWTSLNGSKKGTCNYPGYSGTVFEPIDEFKGDIARCMLYFATRYEDKVASWSHTMINGTSDQVYEDWFISLLVDWHNQDPVSQKELTRNETGYTFQGNRNPFIDHPEYVAKIWGGVVLNNPPSISKVVNTPEYPSSTDMVTITATITDSDGILTNTEIHWGLSPGSLGNTIAMSVSTGDTYSIDTDIPAHTNGTRVYFEIEATDDSSDVSTTDEYSYLVDNNPTMSLFEEDFETVTENQPIGINNWIIYNQAGTNSWEGRLYNSNKYAQMSAFSTGEASNITWLITPEIDLSAISSATFSFLSKDGYNNGDVLEVFISTDYTGTGDPNSSSWSTLSATIASGTSTGYAATFTESGDLDISTYCRNTVYIAYKYTGGDPSVTTTMQIDDVLISGNQSSDAVPVITNISNTPSTPTEEDDVTISATITDSDGTVSSAKIKWGTVSGSYPNEVTLTNSGEIYSGSIDAQVGGTTVYYVIEATDDEAGSSRSDENNFYFSVVVNELPVITGINNDPTNPLETEDVTISATITDSDGTITVTKIKWGTEAGLYPNTDTMTYSGANDIYTGIISKQTGGTTVHFVIEAVDDDSESSRSVENSFTFNTAGNEIPQISNVSFNPIDPESNETVAVSATISDSDGTITSAKVKWGLTTGTYTDEITMSISSGSTFISDSDIPAQADGTSVYFVIYALDEVGGSAQSSENNYIVDDPNILPVIADIAIDPTEPESTESVRVLATLTDSDGTITSAKVKWGLTTGTYSDEITMSISSGNDYISNSNIPAQTDGTEVFYIIEADDNEAGVTISSELNYMVNDPENQAPSISEVILDPIYPTKNDNVTISASVTDMDGTIGQVILKWKLSAGTYTETGMNLSGGKYYGQIPKQAGGEIIYFSIIAEDNESLQTVYDGSYDISESSGIVNLKNNSIRVYPNPTSGNLSVEFVETGFITTIGLYNMIGERVLGISNLSTDKYTVELSGFPAGIYFLKINDSENSLVRKIMLK